MQERRWLGDAEAGRLRDELLAGALPVRFAGPRLVDLGGLELEVPFVLLDAAARPDVRDLFRVVAAEGIQARMTSTVRYLTVGREGYMEVNVRIEDPVSCAFKFVLRWPLHAALFELVSMHGELLFSAQEPAAERVATTLRLAIAPAELDPALRLWRR